MVVEKNQFSKLASSVATQVMYTKSWIDLGMTFNGAVPLLN